MQDGDILFTKTIRSLYSEILRSTIDLALKASGLARDKMFPALVEFIPGLVVIRYRSQLSERSDVTRVTRSIFRFWTSIMGRLSNSRWSN
jgi:hypothetical protein